MRYRVVVGMNLPDSGDRVIDVVYVRHVKTSEEISDNLSAKC